MALGRAAEQLAAQDLEARGATILLRNFRRRTGELDIVAREGAALVVVEVRLRSSEAYGGAAASIVRRKQARIVRTTAQLLQSHRELAHLPVRFDVAVVSVAPTRWQVEWIRHAFEA
ncbi:MAG: YraN family protein [Steroidobacteraceae bacterium]